MYLKIFNSYDGYKKAVEKSQLWLSENALQIATIQISTSAFSYGINNSTQAFIITFLYTSKSGDEL